MNPLSFFTDPVLRAPTIGSMLMCFSAALVGVLVFVRKRSLVGEALSHATYPGVTLAIVLAGFFALEQYLAPLVLVGAFGSALIGFWVIDGLERRLRVSPDAALCAVLALFFGAGVTVASIGQASYPHLQRQLHTYLYGQAATMTDIHLVIYSLLGILVTLFIAAFYKEILTLSFDSHFAKAAGLHTRLLEGGLFVLLVLVLVVGIRCTGVILMSAMLIAPAAAARQFTNQLSKMLFIAALFGVASGFLGIYSSLLLSRVGEKHYAVPSGPMIVLVAGVFTLYALLLAPQRGLLMRYFRIVRFRAQCREENLLKALWRLSEGEAPFLPLDLLCKRMGTSSWLLQLRLHHLVRQQAVEKEGNSYRLSSLGLKRGARIVRLHRLWEVYLVHALGLSVQRVHASAEEMEHILTPELEAKLTALLDNPTRDPHAQPIPSSEEAHA